MEQAAICFFAAYPLPFTPPQTGNVAASAAKAIEDVRMIRFKAERGDKVANGLPAPYGTGITESILSITLSLVTFSASAS